MPVLAGAARVLAGSEGQHLAPTVLAAEGEEVCGPVVAVTVPASTLDPAQDAVLRPCRPTTSWSAEDRS